MGFFFIFNLFLIAAPTFHDFLIFGKFQSIKRKHEVLTPSDIIFQFNHFSPFSSSFSVLSRVGKTQLRETQNSQMFQIWKSLIKVFPHISREVGKTVFLWNSQSWNDQNIPGVCIHHSLPHFLSQKSLLYLAFMLVCMSVRDRALPWWSYSL